MPNTFPVVAQTREDALSRLIDEAAIRDLTARFADAATRGDVERFCATWAPDGQFKIGKGVHAVGLDDIETTFRGLREGREFFVQFAAQGPIHIDGDEASSSCIVNEAARGPGQTYYRNHAVSTDRLRRTDAGWVFVERHFLYLWLDTSPFAGDSIPFPTA